MVGIYPICGSHGVGLVWVVAVVYSLTEAACAGHKPEQVGPMEVKRRAGDISVGVWLSWDGCRMLDCRGW